MGRGVGLEGLGMELGWLKRVAFMVNSRFPGPLTIGKSGITSEGSVVRGMHGAWGLEVTLR
ncbi:hypothetical protein Tter_2853 [Thermobaculum terrenum ATCC BAA-798]|uniref:Uncharacterized protein n=1 Tax=Thermobaculum terrenum (strain ATCC BAA-798 / CCMEE 7001 / YNP1) TaxID=525904 RepID=D1CJ15_THET1|nr:hypothetical protein Tter_2853 [Thermobaculum terrenum ATCC BAA-798]